MNTDPRQMAKYGVPVIIVIVIALMALMGGEAALASVDSAFGGIVDFLVGILFWSIPLPVLDKMPLIVLVLFGGAIFFTLRFAFINIRGFKHAIDVTRGKYDNPDDPGEVSHFQALSSALSATVGLGNIAGVAIAVSVGGPGAVFWMMMTALFGMTSKFAECTLGQMYRRVDEKGDVSGGPMIYLREGITELSPSLKPLGVGLSVLFTVLCIGSSFGGGNMFQANQAFQASQKLIPALGGTASAGTMRVISESPRDIDVPARHLRFRQRDEASLFGPAERIVIKKSDWKKEGDAVRTEVPVAAIGEDVAWELDADQTGVIEIVNVDEDRGVALWQPQEVSLVGLTKPASEGQPGMAVLQAGEAVELELTPGKARARVVREANPNPYFPADSFTVAQADWTEQDGVYVYEIQAQAAEETAKYDVATGVLNTMEVALIEGREIKGWAPVAEVRAMNPTPFEGGADNRMQGFIFGLVLAILVGVVIIGGIKSIARVAEKIVPTMCVLYVLAALWIVLTNASAIPEATMVIFESAFSFEAGLGGFLGVVVTGVTRAAFSSEAGIGSAAIAHSAAKTDEPVREGIVALLEPFIDTIIVCFMTGIVIVITKAYADPTVIGMEGVQLTQRAFGSEISFFPYVLAIAVFLFAYSTMISWSYYGERCWTYLFGAEQSMSYRIIFLVFVILGPVASLGNVLTFSDLMLLSMAFPNIFGVVLLSGKLREALAEYWGKYRRGEFRVYR